MDKYRALIWRDYGIAISRSANSAFNIASPNLGPSVDLITPFPVGLRHAYWSVGCDGNLRYL